MVFYEFILHMRVFQLSSIIDFDARSDILVQPTQLIFGDSIEYQVPYIIGVIYKQEFQDFAISDYETIQFNSS
jgi:hypothetical protein